MLSELLATRAALYVAGTMPAADRDVFELVLEFQPELRAEVADLSQVAAALALTDPRPAAAPPSYLKTRILSSLGTRPAPNPSAAMVVTDPQGRVEWLNPAFSAMCGFSLPELVGLKPGQVLQGPKTDPAAVQRIRNALTERRSVCETLVNYHKNGTAYVAEIEITPVLDDDRTPLWFVARERRLA